jgi:hypothetical protein
VAYATLDPRVKDTVVIVRIIRIVIDILHNLAFMRPEMWPLKRPCRLFMSAEWWIDDDPIHLIRFAVELPQVSSKPSQTSDELKSLQKRSFEELSAPLDVKEPWASRKCRPFDAFCLSRLRPFVPVAFLPHTAAVAGSGPGSGQQDHVEVRSGTAGVNRGGRRTGSGVSHRCGAVVSASGPNCIGAKEPRNTPPFRDGFPMRPETAGDP